MDLNCIVKKTICKLRGYAYVLLYNLFRLLPVRERVIVFHSEGDFTDNSRVFYEYLLNYGRKKYSFVWLMSEVGEYPNRERTEFIYYPWQIRSIRTVWFLARAKLVIYTHGLPHLRRRKGQIVINLWHGIPIKSAKGTRKSLRHNFNYLINVGDLSGKLLAKFIGCDECSLLTLGYPRFDLMLNSQSKGEDNPFVPKCFYGRVIMWMPTFRASVNINLSEMDCDSLTGLPLLYTETDMCELDVHLQSKNVFVIIKIHHLQMHKNIFTKQFHNIKILNDQEILSQGLQLYEILGKSDALLSDYSSVAIDYLLLNKPIGFVIDDIGKYKASRGFICNDIEPLLAGYKIKYTSQLYSFIDDISEGKDITKHLRDSVIDSLITYKDNKNCERIANFFNL